MRACALSALLSLPASPACGQGFDPALQRSFIEGARLLESGDVAAAERVFRELLVQTGSARVRLELARALFLQKRYREARVQFEEVLLDPELPWRVRENIESFIAAIEEVVGYAKLSVSLVSDSNPRNLSSQREFTIAGIRLRFTAPEDNKRVTGLRYSTQVLQPLSDGHGVSAYLAGSYLDFPGDSLDRLTLDVGGIKALASGAARLRAGVEAGTFGDRRLYEFPYVGGSLVVDQSTAHRVTGEGKVGRVTFPGFTYLDANYTSVSLAAARLASDSATVSASILAEDSRAREKPYSYYGVILNPAIAWRLSEPALRVKVDLSAARRRYADIDPFFGERRIDRRNRLELTVGSRAWRVMNLRPTLSASIEENRSSIDFYAYRKVNLSVALE